MSPGYAHAHHGMLPRARPATTAQFHTTEGKIMSRVEVRKHCMCGRSNYSTAVYAAVKSHYGHHPLNTTYLLVHTSGS
jgi:hypothetical protein